ncbi:hypothetical protein F444_15003 [Phytophthora nicotianae P1976]|uniref:RxLR effector protein n=1 Tax=Phytophthora nicotianae P1976 TaxID=1317066 RepID=A0A080ZND2_PHYNI|nr:hypothetical protein F444_15003 [Phytophthora nicotianae P1976]
MVLLLVAFNIASSKELSSPAEKEETSLHIIAPVIDAVTFTADKKRFLRTQSIHAADVGHPDDEERAYAWATKLGSLLRKKDPVKLEEIVEKKKEISSMAQGWRKPNYHLRKVGTHGSGSSSELEERPTLPRISRVFCVLAKQQGRTCQGMVAILA